MNRRPAIRPSVTEPSRPRNKRSVPCVSWGAIESHMARWPCIQFSCRPTARGMHHYRILGEHFAVLFRLSRLETETCLHHIHDRHHFTNTIELHDEALTFGLSIKSGIILTVQYTSKPKSTRVIQGSLWAVTCVSHPCVSVTREQQH